MLVRFALILTALTASACAYSARYGVKVNAIDLGREMALIDCGIDYLASLQERAGLTTAKRAVAVIRSKSIRVHVDPPPLMLLQPNALAATHVLGWQLGDDVHIERGANTPIENTALLHEFTHIVLCRLENDCDPLHEKHAWWIVVDHAETYWAEEGGCR
jgi:hypothetical protein